jgi:glutathione-regulated potassium-efflux system ancillary protein KefF
MHGVSAPRRRILLLHFHPAPHKSRVNRRLVAEAERTDGVTVRHLYDIYPDFLIDVQGEQRLLENLFRKDPLHPRGVDDNAWEVDAKRR